VRTRCFFGANHRWVCTTGFAANEFKRERTTFVSRCSSEPVRTMETQWLITLQKEPRLSLQWSQQVSPSPAASATVVGLYTSSLKLAQEPDIPALCSASSSSAMSIFFYQPLSVHCWTSAFLLTVHRLRDVIEGRLSHFLPRWLRTGWQGAISQGKIPWNTPPWLGIEPGPRGGQTVSYPTELSWLTCNLN